MTPGYGSRPALRPSPSPETRYSYGLAPVNMNAAHRAYGSIRELPTGHPLGHTPPPGYLLPPHLKPSGDFAHSTPPPPPPVRYVPGRATNMSYAQALASPKPRPVHRMTTVPRDPMGQFSRGHHPNFSSPHLHFHAQPPSSYHQPSRQPHNYYHHPHQIPPGPHPPGYPSPFPLQVRNQHPEQYRGGMGGRPRGPDNTYWRRNEATKGNSRQPAHPASIQTNYRAPPGLEDSRRVTPAGLQPCYGGYRVAQHPETRPATPAKTPPQLLTIDSGVPSDRADSPHNLSPLDFNGPSTRTFGSSAYQSGATIVPDAPATPHPGSFTQEDPALVTQSLLPRLKFGNFSQSKSGEVQRSRILYSIVSDPKSLPQAKSTCDDDVGVVVFMPLDKKGRGSEAEFDSAASYTSGTSDVDGVDGKDHPLPVPTTTGDVYSPLNSLYTLEPFLAVPITLRTKLQARIASGSGSRNKSRAASPTRGPARHGHYVVDNRNVSSYGESSATGYASGAKLDLDQEYDYGDATSAAAPSSPGHAMYADSDVKGNGKAKLKGKGKGKGKKRARSASSSIPCASEDEAPSRNKPRRASPYPNSEAQAEGPEASVLGLGGSGASITDTREHTHPPGYEYFPMTLSFSQSDYLEQQAPLTATSTQPSMSTSTMPTSASNSTPASIPPAPSQSQSKSQPPDERREQAGSSSSYFVDAEGRFGDAAASGSGSGSRWEAYGAGDSVDQSGRGPSGSAGNSSLGGLAGTSGSGTIGGEEDVYDDTPTSLSTWVENAILASALGSDSAGSGSVQVSEIGIQQASSSLSSTSMATEPPLPPHVLAANLPSPTAPPTAS
ncbi:hypothetical protein DFP72DRAFT_1071110 [Ephemerocybe angulata]|uniref:Uncharacterized protein n=1 Tax=Ephemerocybe angulata TaxID=980116 RepID=A0A8H6HS24_9AGAR|nr:hypothetical protein DFP72DRAFT_1071110 [Tulosesus angulatus]